MLESIRGNDYSKNVRSAQNESAPKQEYDTAQRSQRLEKIKALETADKSENIGSVESEITSTEKIENFAQSHDFFGHPEHASEVIQLLVSESKSLMKMGLSLEEIYVDPDRLKNLHNEIAHRFSEAQNAESTKTNLSIQDRFKELGKSDQPVASILQTLKSEFEGRMDKATIAVLDKYSTLLSSQIFDDPQELEAVETLFFTHDGDFTEESFTAFVQTIYEQSDSVVSEESKRRIEETFKISRNTIKTGRGLSNATRLSKDDGSFVYHSEKTALEFRPGIKTYMNPNGEAVLSLDGSSRPHPISIPPHMLENGESIAELANYALIRRTVYDEMGQLTNLFGGGTEAEMDNPDENTIAKANHFTRLLIGRQAPDTILSRDDLDNLRYALKALHDPSQIGESASLTSLADLGILSNGNLQWERIDSIGHILREKQFYRTFEMNQSGEAHRLLTAELERLSPYENESKTKMSAFQKSRHTRGYVNFIVSSRFLLKKMQCSCVVIPNKRHPIKFRNEKILRLLGEGTYI